MRLAAFDFDWTLINDDSDQLVLRDLSLDLHAKLMANKDKTQWTDLVGMLLAELAELGFRESDVVGVLSKTESIIQLLKTLKQSDLYIVIVSDANSVYINTILQYIDEIITNPASFDNGGRLHITRLNPHSTPHNCPNRCSLNLCKGDALKGLDTTKYERVFYCGDGKNDFCPSVQMGESDILYVRRGMGLDKQLKKMGNRERVVCKIVEWSDHAELLEVYKY